MTYKILAIDDHPETLDIIVMTLQASGYDVSSTQFPVEGLAMAETVRPHLILLDMNMPVMDGKEVARRLRANPQLAHIPIIMFTAEDQLSQKMAGFEAGVDDYLTKPTEPEEMIERIEAILANAPPRPATPTPFVDNAPPRPAIPTPFVGNNTQTGVVDSEKRKGRPSAPLKAAALRKLVIVIGTRGGAGTTTMAINLAAVTAELGYPTTLVDMDMKQGHIAYYLKQSPQHYLNDLSDLSVAELATALPEKICAYRKNLDLLFTKPNLNGEQPILSGIQTAVLADTLLNSDRFIVVDGGSGLSPHIRPLLDQAEHVILCLRPERVSLSSTKQLVQQIQAVLFNHTRLSILMINQESGKTLPKNAVESFVNYRVLGTISAHPEAMNQAINKGLPLSILYPDIKASYIFRQLALQLVQK